MTTREADQIIKRGKSTTVYNKIFDETFTTIFISRDRYNLYSADGGVYDRSELVIVKQS